MRKAIVLLLLGASFGIVANGQAHAGVDASVRRDVSVARDGAARRVRLFGHRSDRKREVSIERKKESKRAKRTVKSERTRTRKGTE